MRRMFELQRRRRDREQCFPAAARHELRAGVPRSGLPAGSRPLAQYMAYGPLRFLGDAAVLALLLARPLKPKASCHLLRVAVYQLAAHARRADATSTCRAGMRCVGIPAPKASSTRPRNSCAKASAPR